jgi:NTE family protein
MKRFGLALGGGGVRGIAHIGVLELLDHLGARPARIAGCSTGAMIGALYAAGMSGSELRDLIGEHTVGDDDTWRDVLKKAPSLLRWVTSLAPETQRGGLLNADRLINRLLHPVAKLHFEELDIPLTIVATDYWAVEQVVFTEGPVLPAIRASMSIPGVFAPVLHEGRVLVDGGLINQVPYELIAEDMDFTIAVDATGERVPGKKEVPSAVEAVLGASDIMQRALMNWRLESSPPDILVRPQIRNVEMLDFGKVTEVLRQSKDALAGIEAELAARGIGAGFDHRS